MRGSFRWILLMAMFFALTGCEKDIHFDLQDSTAKLVIEATIENGQPPIVILSQSLSYFSTINADILAGSFVHNAQIRISDGRRSQLLKEYSTQPLPGINLFYYTIDSSNLSGAFAGSFNSTYTMTISSEGKTYNAQTTIPALTKTIDSVWWKSSPGNPDTTLVSLQGRFSDPPGYGNYIRYFTKTGKGAFFPGLTSVYDDQIIDGLSYDGEIERGVDRNAKFDVDNYSFFSRGDTVVIKFCNIDKPTFDFWRTMEYSYSSIGNPFASPTKVLSNIDGGALGYFGGYAAQYRTIIIPK